jgi:hypothetical protein
VHLTNYRVIENKTNIAQIRELYKKVNETLPSVVNSKEHDEIIHQRLECYAMYDDYRSRISNCNNAYVKTLVEQARTTIKSRPDMGLFVSNVSICPVMYNLCVGKTRNDVSKCVVFEKQCIDYTLDTYWRGAAQYTEQQYRTE